MKTKLADALETSDCTLWLGDTKSFDVVLQAHKYKLFHPEKAADVLAYYDREDEVIASVTEDGPVEYESYLIQVEGNVGIINIHGSMTSEDSWANRYYGVVAYAEIVRALYELVESAEVATILLNMDTGGGSVAGLEAATEAVVWAMESKDVYSINSGALMSAGYWLAAPTKQINGSKMSETGSIGVLIVHRSVYRMLKDVGVDYTVVKAGKYKAVGHPTQKLSTEDKNILQAKADKLYEFFLDHAINYRPALSIATSEDWAEGLTFFGEEAVQLGLLDEITTLSNMVETLDTVDKTATEVNNTRDTGTLVGVRAETNTTFTTEADDMAGKKKQVVLRTPEEQAALASGVPEAELANLPTSTDTGKPTPKEGAKDVNAPEAEKGVQTPEVSTELTSYLKEQNATLSAQVAELTHKLAQSETAKATLKADEEGLRTIAEASLHHMQLVLRQGRTICTELPSSSIVAQHASVRKEFEKFIPVGQKTVPMAEEDDPATATAMAQKMGIVRKT